MDKARQFVVYQFQKKEKIDLDKADHIIAITPNAFLELSSPKRGTTYVVTALDRLHNESKPTKIKVK